MIELVTDPGVLAPRNVTGSPATTQPVTDPGVPSPKTVTGSGRGGRNR